MSGVLGSRDTGQVLVSRGTSRRRGGTRHLIGVLLSWCCGLVAAAIVALAVALTAVPAIAGGHTLTVLSGSMTPALPVGSVVVDRPEPVGSLRVGDIVTYTTTGGSGDPVLITHRIVAVQHGSGSPVFTTKGDANDVADRQPVRAEQIRGEVWYHVPYVGTVRDILLSKGTVLIAVAGVLFALGGWMLWRVWRREPVPGGDRG